MPAVAILIGRTTKADVTSLEFLPFVVEAEDQPVVQAAGAEAMLRLRVDGDPASGCPVDLLFVEEIAVARAKQRHADPATPCGLGGSMLSPQATCNEAIAAAVERVDVAPEGVEPVELAPA